MRDLEIWPTFESEKFGDIFSRSFWNSSVSDALNSTLFSVYVSGACSRLSANHFLEFSQESWKCAFLFSARLREGKRLAQSHTAGILNFSVHLATAQLVTWPELREHSRWGRSGIWGNLDCGALPV